MTLLALTMCCLAAPPQPVHWGWRGDLLRCAQPCRLPWPMSEGLDLPPHEWLTKIVENWMTETTEGCFDGDMYRDGRVDMKDLNVLSRFWKPKPSTLEQAAEMLKEIMNKEIL